MSGATVNLMVIYDNGRPGSKAIDDNKSSNGFSCAVATYNPGNDTIIEIVMTSSVDVAGIEVLARSDCCRKYTRKLFFSQISFADPCLIYGQYEYCNMSWETRKESCI